MAKTASFNPVSRVLTVLGDNLDNNIVVGRDASGRILINHGAVPIQGGTATAADTSLIQVFGQAGNDTISLDESNGALPAAHLFGGDGNDTITGGSGNDMLFGQSGNDTLVGGAGNDLLFGGIGNDVLIGGKGNDQMFGEAGDDRMIWNPGDGTDVMEGGDGNDTAEINGGNGAESFTIIANGSRVLFERFSPAPFSLDIGTTENLVLHAGGGNDVITAGDGLAGLISLTLDGGAGNDTITGGDGNDLLIGGDGDDTVTGGHGNDLAQLGSGNDTFVWNPGDGSDVVEGGVGTDKLVFNGSNVNENIGISANQGRVKLTRDVGKVIMDINSIEHIQLAAGSGADNVTVGDLSGTGVTRVEVNLGSDGDADAVTVNGTAGNDTINVIGSGGSVLVTGLAAQVAVDLADAGDKLTINAGAGNDTVNATNLAAGVIGLVIDGGAGNDTIIGSQGNDFLIGGDGNDVVTGGRGNDDVLLGSGNDTFIWNPGDGSDTVEGQAGTDTLVFNGANVGENITISTNGSRAELFRDVGNVVMDLGGIEHIQLATLGGADNVTVQDLTGTSVQQVAIDLSSKPGSGVGDGQADTVVINGTDGNDVINVTLKNGVVTISGLATDVTISGFDASDRIVINGLGGDDVINASGLGGAMLFTANGGDGSDILIGSRGSDTLNGGAGDDLLIGNGGQDVLDGGPGGNIVLAAPMVVGNTAALADVSRSAALLAQYMASSFVPSGAALGTTPLADAASSQHPLLATSHV